MPSLEIICIDQNEPISFSNLPFDLETESSLRSHRSPKPLFQADFDKLQGCIYHVLKRGSTNAYELLKRDWYNADGSINGREENVEFLPEIAPSMYELLQTLLADSPAGQVLFTTDYQFGPARIQRSAPLSLEEFWSLHNCGRIRMNSLYKLISS